MKCSLICIISLRKFIMLMYGNAVGTIRDRHILKSFAGGQPWPLTLVLHGRVCCGGLVTSAAGRVAPRIHRVSVHLFPCYAKSTASVQRPSGAAVG